MLTSRNQVLKTPAAATEGKRNTEPRGISALENYRFPFSPQADVIWHLGCPFQSLSLLNIIKNCEKSFFSFSFFFELLLFSDLHLHQKKVKELWHFDSFEIRSYLMYNRKPIPKIWRVKQKVSWNWILSDTKLSNPCELEKTIFYIYMYASPNTPL